MKNLLLSYQKHKWQIWFLLGLCGALFFCLPYLVLGRGSYVQIHDQLDGEVLNYIYRAKYLFSGSKVIPEFMNGMSVDSMTPPAPMGVLFYRFLPPFTAFAAMHIFGILTGYIGMFFLLKELIRHPLIAALVSCLFVYLPFYPVYGLAILGQPLLLWALLQLYQGKRTCFSLFCVLLYGLNSSFALVGFAWIGILLLAIVITALRHKKAAAKRLSTAWGVLFTTYLLCNLSLIAQILGLGATEPLHREEMILASMPELGKYFGDLFLNGGSYGKSYHTAITVLALCVLILYPLLLWFRKKRAPSEASDTVTAWSITNYRILLGLFCLALLIAALACLWKSSFIVALRMSLGGALKTFQADRIYWLLPCCWYLILALCLEILWTIGNPIHMRSNTVPESKTGFTAISLFRPAACCLAGGLTLLFLGNAVYENSAIYHNLRLMIFPDTYHLTTWDEFYASDVYEQIDQYIGKDKSAYRVLSLGITPAAALYNGFYCLDGYSNLYSLHYKQEFRKIMEDELDKSPEVSVYFDTWGNRCYLMNAETGNYMMIGKYSGSTYKQLSLNTNQMYEMGARYLFSAMPLENAEELGLTLMREEPFSTPESYFAIWLYEITPA